jgi:mannose-1-phosphate guanylyltransferase/phosphomannomutase
MSALLRQLGVESFSAQAFVDPAEQALMATNLPAATQQTRKLVQAMGATLGFVFNRSAERITLIDEQGEEIPPDQALHLVLMLVTRHRDGGSVVLPSNSSRAAERIALNAGFRVERTGITQASLVQAASDNSVVFAGAPDGRFLFPSFSAGSDAVLNVAKLLELLALEGKPLSALRSEMPRASMIHQRAPVPWSLKGLAMRELSERVKEVRVEQADGIRVEEREGWAQLVPDPDEPLFHIYAEGETGAQSAALARRYRAMLEEVLERS